VIVAGFLTAGIAVAGVVVANVGPASAAGSPVGTWSAAVNVPGTLTANEPGITDVSCAPGAECVAAGVGFGAANSPFIVSEKNGAWGPAAVIPGLAKLGGQTITSISCPASGDCLVTGQYGDPVTGPFQGWYAQEVGGRWGSATPIPGLVQLNTGGDVEGLVASCPSAGNCALASSYSIASSTSSTFTGFVVSEAGYHWTNAAPVPGLASLLAGGFADITALSCASPGNCAVGGTDQPVPANSATPPPPTGATPPPPTGATPAARTPGLAGLRAAEPGPAAAFLRARHLTHPTASTTASSPAMVPFVASEVNGVWQPVQAPGLGLTSTGAGFVTAVACPAAGACFGAGFYSVSDAATAAGGSFLVSQSGTTWSTPVTSSIPYVGAVDCRSVSICAAAVVDAKGLPAIAPVVHGAWGKATENPGMTGLTFKGKKVTSILPEVLACPTAGNCSVGGASLLSSTVNATNLGPAVLVSEANGSWSPVREPGLALGDGTAGFWGMACASAANCAAGGVYETATLASGAFTMVEVPVRATATTLTRSHSIVTYGAEQREKLTVTVTAKQGTPGGKVTIKAGTATVCVITLKAGTGSCTLTAKQFKAGRYHLVAGYPGGWPYGSSASGSWPLTVQA
jgi:hypothetical protein